MLYHFPRSSYLVIYGNGMNYREFKENIKNMPFFGGDVAELFSLSPSAMRNGLSRWKKRGLLVELKKGLYALSKSERQVALSPEIAAANIYQPSYISLESALSYYKMIPEKVSALTSVTARKTKTFQNEEGIFIYRHLKKPLYFGFIQQKDAAGYPYFLAEPEKALLDYLYLNLGQYKTNAKGYLSGSLRLQNRAMLNKKKLKSYVCRFKVKKLSRIIEELL